MDNDPLFEACSGQSLRRGAKNTWGICLVDGKGPAWWRQKNKSGHTRLFPDYETANRFAERLNHDPSLALPRLRIVVTRTVEIIRD